MTFEEFQESGEYVRCVKRALPEQDAPEGFGYVYEGGLYIMLGEEDDEYDLFLYGEVITSKDLNWLEQRLYQFGIEEEYFKS